ncbi:hypothetical protein J6590_040585 [Homalodisca vitripennis]|nr:hypothetical protein J6590_040585 [Homalodisca vitripennis]
MARVETYQLLHEDLQTAGNSYMLVVVLKQVEQQCKARNAYLKSFEANGAAKSLSRAVRHSKDLAALPIHVPNCTFYVALLFYPGILTFFGANSDAGAK